ncbi:ATP-binding protein [Plantactinospora siamensis]|uniref:ATP-binding protein n=1 Tax=Plantactinospora siamensis TaxID=555372 RepID=A0ABV6NX77_9ACTN
MPTDVRCLLATTEPYPVLRLVGTLDGPTVDRLRVSLLTCLADQAGTVIVDVSDLAVADPAGLAVFPEVSRAAVDWPVGELLIYAPAGSPAEWRDGDVPVSDSLDEAYRRLDATAGPRLNARLEPAVGAARRARQLVTDGCGRWDVPELAGSACIAITEMVNNVVVHAQTPMTVRLGLRDGALHVAVRDWSLAPAVFSGLAPTTSAGGRGLLLIDTVARRWGASELADGKVVWAALYPEDEAHTN